MPKVPKIASLQCLYNIFKKKLEMKFIFLYVNKHQVSYKLISTLGHQSFLQGDTVTIDGHDQASQSIQSKKCAITLQYLKKEVRNEVHFLYADKHQCF